MAIIFPKASPKNLGEKIAQSCMDMQLDDGYTIIRNFRYDYSYHDKKYNREYNRKGETDFVICSPEMGFIFCEVKEGEIAEDENGFFRQDGDEKNYKIFKNENPFQQVERNMYAIMDLLVMEMNVKHRDSFGIPYTSIIFFPQSDFLCHSIDYENTYVDSCYLEENLETRLKAIVNKRVPTNKLKNVNCEMIERIVNEYFIPHIESNPNLRPLLNTINVEMAELTDSQREILEKDLYDRVLVKGGPGTGKSLLALAKAEQLAKRGYNVLLTCYNKALGKQLEKLVSENSNIRVNAWCEFLCEFIETRQDDFSRPSTDDLKELYDFYHKKIPEQFIGCLQNCDDSTWRPDAVVVDEGQDIDANLFDALLQYFTKHKENPFVVFIDPAQNVFYSDTNTEVQFKNCIDKEYNLPGTFRVSRNIINYIKDVLPDNYIPPLSYIEYGRVKEYFYTDDDEQASQILEALKELEKNKLKNTEIMIISYKHFVDSAVKKSTNIRKVINGKLNNTLLCDLKDDELLFYTVRTSKGLEADAVLLIDLPKKSRIREESEFAQWFYIGTTRAKYFLYCFYEKE
ncbi:NERD domain-containing protein [Spirochaetota bacterium]